MPINTELSVTINNTTKSPSATPPRPISPPHPPPSVLSLISPPSTHPVQVPRWALNFALGIKYKFKDFSGEILKTIKFTVVSWFSTGELSKNYFLKIQKFHKMRCYFGQNAKPKGSISLSNFDGQLSYILFTCLCLRVRVLCVVAVA